MSCLKSIKLPSYRIFDNSTQGMLDSQIFDNSDMKTLAERFIEAYSESSFESYSALARAAGLKSVSTVSDIKRGRVFAESPSLVPLAHVLGVNALWLQQGKGSKRLISQPPPVALVKYHITKEQKEIAQLIELYNHATDEGKAQILRSAKAVERFVSDKIQLSDQG